MNNDDYQPFRYVLTVKGTNTTRQNLELPYQPEQYIHLIESVALVNETSATTYARLYTSNGVEQAFHREWRILAAANLYYDNVLKLHILPQEIVGIAFFGITSGDLLNAYIRGRRKRVE